MDFADPKSNIAFKKIFGNENKKEILISFLNAVLDFKGEKEIKDITILDPYQAPKIEGLKETILDVRAVDRRGISFIVEMQIKKQPYFDKRVLYYTSRAYAAQIEKGDDYPKLNQVIFIGILDFEMFEGEDYLTRHLILNKKTLKQEIKDLELNFIELPKFTKKEDELKTVVGKWIYFIKNAKNLKVIPETLKTQKEIVEAFEIAKTHTWTKKELEIYEYWQIWETGDRLANELALKEGFEEGKKQGREQAVKEIYKQGVKDTARKMLKERVPLDIIAKCTGLTKKEILVLEEKVKIK